MLLTFEPASLSFFLFLFFFFFLGGGGGGGGRVFRNSGFSSFSLGGRLGAKPGSFGINSRPHTAKMALTAYKSVKVAYPTGKGWVEGLGFRV